MDISDPNALDTIRELSFSLTDGLHNRNYERSLRAAETLFDMMPAFQTFHMVMLSLFRLDREVAEIRGYSDRMMPQIELRTWEHTLLTITAGTLIDIRDLMSSPTATNDERCQICYYMGCRMVYLGQAEFADRMFSICAVTDSECLEKSLAMGECETRGITVDDDASGRFFHGTRARQAARQRYNVVGDLMRNGRWTEALPLAQEALTLALQELGEYHVVTAASYNGLGVALRGVGRLQEALPQFQLSYKIQRGVLGARHPAVIKCLDHLADVHRDLGDSGAASRCLEEILNIRRRWNP